MGLLRLFLESKYADRRLEYPDYPGSFDLAWYDTPTKGQAVVISYCRANYPALAVFTDTVSKQKREGARLLKEGWVRSERSW